VQTVIITLGARGAFVAAPSIRQLIPGFRVKPVDTTAAGDVFNGALAVALGEGRPLLEAVRFANAAAAISVTRLGAQSSAPARNEIEAFLAGPRAFAPALSPEAGRGGNQSGLQAIPSAGSGSPIQTAVGVRAHKPPGATTL
jgi:hypothetical protein